ncbi:MAG: lysoplasmalogenase [Deltaproteobacteria bacterium]|nr:lysoplasmalogenase [Deltaproteobacteria bacterium]
MWSLFILPAALVLLAGVLHFENTEHRVGLVAAKTSLSLLFIVTAILQPHPVPDYYHVLLFGLAFCLIGDVFLALPQKRMFLPGLVSFLIGHVCYILAFLYVAHINAFTYLGAIITFPVSAGIYLYLRPHLNSMNRPVLAYVIVISIMLCGAWSILGDSGILLMGRISIFIAAVCFYLSDVFVARDRFVKKEYFNRVVGLPTYYVAQFLLAFSVAWIEPTAMA